MNSNERDVNINSELLISKPLPDNRWTYTLASRLGDMLYLAEKLFGPRDLSYTPLGIEFVSDGPKVWFPGDSQQDRKHIAIRLDLVAATDMAHACYQLAHETVHLLAPRGGITKGRITNNLEEGVATYYAGHYMEVEMGMPNWTPNLPSYKEVLEKVTPLFCKDKYCIRKLRSEQPAFTKMTEEQISSAFPDLSAEDVKFLLSKFNRNAN